ncbi:MAG TPA: ATPase, T2SS/T4P/T4SS family [Oscillatoriaceae cyanobacterium]
MSTPHIGIWLMTLGFITRRQLTQALDVQAQGQEPLETVLLQQRMLRQEELDGAIALQDELATISHLHDFAVSPEALTLVPRMLATRERLVPLRLIGERLIVAFPRGQSSQEQVAAVLNKQSATAGLLVHGIAFPPESMDKALSHFYDPASAERLVARAVERVIPGGRPSATKQVVEVATPSDAQEAPIVELVNRVLTQAITMGASDLHLASNDQGLAIQARVDGVMVPMMDLPREVEASVFTRLKLMADLNIAERRRPQDGRMSVQLAGKPVDLRVACISSHWGEIMVLRILRPLNVAGLTHLGFGAADLEKWQRIIQRPNGLILVTGPTGSGKTSTLYATLNQFDRQENNILTVEDPVEYPVPGIGQIQVLPAIGLTFAAALRSILRLDPDVVLVGEIRDHETLEIALEAAMTGHLVLSTLHTNDAVSAIGRLIEMGAPRHQVAATVVGVLAQRLVRRICPQCRVPAPADAEARAFLGVPADAPLELARGTGCDHCNQLGYRGMVGVYEVIEVDAPFAELISAGASNLDLWRKAREGGMTTLLDDGKAKVRSQQTTIPEVQRVIGYRDLL